LSKEQIVPWLNATHTLILKRKLNPWTALQDDTSCSQNICLWDFLKGGISLTYWVNKSGWWD